MANPLRYDTRFNAGLMLRTRGGYTHFPEYWLNKSKITDKRRQMLGVQGCAARHSKKTKVTLAKITAMSDG